MSAASAAAPVLAREAAAFTRYLVGAAPTAYVTERYAAAHAVRAGLRAGGRFDVWLVALARAHPVTTFAVDAFARCFAPRSLVRRKLVLLLAVLEVSPGLHARVDTGWGPWPLAVLHLAGRGVALALAVALSTVVLAPLWAVAALRERAR
jgi:hypothetical protein